MLTLFLLASLGPVLTAVISIVIVGVLWWATGLVPFPQPVKTALMVVFVVVLLVIVIRFLIQVFPELGSL